MKSVRNWTNGLVFWSFQGIFVLFVVEISNLEYFFPSGKFTMLVKSLNSSIIADIRHFLLLPEALATSIKPSLAKQVVCRVLL